jgi:hypothetical protein
MNERQEAILSELKDKFDALNQTTSVKGNILDIASLQKDMADAKTMRAEIELYNEAFLKEFSTIFQESCGKLKEDLERLGIECRLHETQLCMGPLIANYSPVSYVKSTELIALPDNSHVSKTTKFMFSWSTYSCDTLEELCSLRTFSERLKDLLRKVKP